MSSAVKDDHTLTRFGFRILINIFVRLIILYWSLWFLCCSSINPLPIIFIVGNYLMVFFPRLLSSSLWRCTCSIRCVDFGRSAFRRLCSIIVTQDISTLKALRVFTIPTEAFLGSWVLRLYREIGLLQFVVPFGLVKRNIICLVLIWASLLRTIDWTDCAEWDTLLPPRSVHARTCKVFLACFLPRLALCHRKIVASLFHLVTSYGFSFL